MNVLIKFFKNWLVSKKNPKCFEEAVVDGFKDTLKLQGY